MSNIWVDDADYMDINSEELRNIYKNYCVKDYLEYTNKLGIASTKGIGKTFLLKAKRINSQENGEICYPKDNMLNVIFVPSIHASIVKYLEDYNNWVFLWESAILLSIFTHLFKETHENYFLRCPNHKDLIDYIGSGEVSYYFARLITTDSRKLLSDLKSEIALALDELYKIRSSICIFIDRIDQAFENQVHAIAGQTKMSSGNKNASFWQYAQVSLAQAAYQIRAKNTHVKIYYAIRQEALYGAESMIEEYQNFHGSIVSLNYSGDELEAMMNTYILKEKDENLILPEFKKSNPQLAFFGIANIPHKRIKNENEKCFDYMLRHTLGRPRDIMVMCNDLVSYGHISKNRVNTIRSRINICSKNLLESYIFQTENFLFNIVTEDLNVLYNFIPSNKITLRMLKKICNQFNTYFQDKYNQNLDDCFCVGCARCEKMHPFCQLYNVGLLGIVANDNTIRFKHISEGLLTYGNHFLPHSKFYYLHPAVANKVQLIRESRGKDFILCNEIVGHRNCIKFDKPRINYLNRRANKVFISSTCFDLKEERIAIHQQLYDMGYDAIKSDDFRFNTRVNSMHIHDHCICEALKCKNMIFIIGSNYGSEYLGNKFKQEKEELIAMGFANPSISLMEYYVASKHKVIIHVFFHKKIMSAKYATKENKDNMVDARVFDVMDFITNQIINSWMCEYEDISILKQLVFINLSK